MEELAQFSRIIERIYDAALDAELWPEALEQICAFVQGCAIAIYYDGVGSAPSFFHAWGYELRFLQSFQTTYSKINPFFPSTLFLEVGKVYAAHEIIPMDDFVRTRLYKEWAQPQGLFDALQINLERSATGYSALAVHRHERHGLCDADAKSRFELIVPHVRRAIAIGKVVEFHKAKESALADTLDGLDAAVVLVARDGRLVHVNQAATTMLTAADVLRASKGRLGAVDARADGELQEAIIGAARGDTGLGVKGIAIALTTDDQSSQVAHVLSLGSGRRRELLPGRAVAAVFVRRMTFAAPAPLEVIAQTYQLTAAEVRVLAALAASTGVADIASVLGLGEATVKSHLHRLFAKTGAKRQADLVRLLANHASPLAPDPGIESKQLERPRVRRARRPARRA